MRPADGGGRAAAPALHEYQREGVRFLYDHPRCLLLDAPGLGKTIQLLGLIQRLRDEGSLERVLVAVDSRMLARQWLDALQAWLPGLAAYDAADAKQFAAFPQTAASCVLVGTYSKLRRCEEWATSFQWSLMVLDEVSAIRGGNAEHASARAVSRCARRAVGLTATPLENNAGDTWAILAAVGTPHLWPKATFDDRFIIFEPGYTLPNGWQKVPPKAVGLRPDHLDELLAYLAQHTLRRDEDDAGVALPARVGDEVVWVQPTPAQRKALTAAARITNPLARHQKVQAACASTDGSSAKALAAVEWLGRHREHRKVLVYAENLDHLDVMGKLLARRGISYVRIEGKVSETQRRAGLERFERDGAIRVLLGSSVLERGLNLQLASALLSLGCSWNPGREAQREGRIRRIGSPHATYTHVTFLIDHRHDRERWNEVFRKRSDGEAIKPA